MTPSSPADTIDPGATSEPKSARPFESVVAVDLGGTHVRAALVDADGTVHDRTRTRTPHGDLEPQFLADLMTKVSVGRSVGRAVVGVPGVIDYDAEQLVQAPNVPQRWIPMLSDEWLSARTGLDVALANDADLAAVGESSFGAGIEARDVVYVTISTGVGAGIVLGHRLMRGRYSGGEIGHTIIDRRLLAAGSDGTVEHLGAGTAMAEASLAAGLGVTGAALAARVRSGDAAAAEIWNDAIRSVAVGVVNLCWLVAPQMVVIGGGVGMNTELVLPIINRFVRDHGPRIEPISIVPARLGDDAGLCGAAAWWKAIGRDG